MRTPVAAARTILLGACVAAACLCATPARARADDPAKLPLVDVSDAAALAANLDKDVLLVGTCKSAEWSDSGKALNIRFEGTDQTGTSAVAFASGRKRLDDAFSGDVAKTITGAQLRIRGHLREYEARAGQKGKPEITISDPSQITIVTPATKP